MNLESAAFVQDNTIKTLKPINQKVNHDGHSHTKHSTFTTAHWERTRKLFTDSFSAANLEEVDWSRSLMEKLVVWSLGQSDLEVLLLWSMEKLFQ